MTPKRLFRGFLENFKTVLGLFLSKGGPYGPSSVCQVLVLEILGKKWSKWGQNGAFRDFLENSSFVFLDIVNVDRGQ